MPPRAHEEPRSAPPAAQRRRQQRRRRDDRVTHHLPARRSSRTDDRVTRTAYADVASIEQPRTAPYRSAAVVMPDWRQVATLAAPNAVATVSLVLALAIAGIVGDASALVVVPLMVPSLLLGIFHRSGPGQGWRAAVAVNLATMLVVFPLLVIRQSTVRVPYLDLAHGTVFAAVASTVAVLTALFGLALYVAWISRQDPESAPLLFMPAALLVPLLTSATEFARLDAALAVTGLIFALATVLLLGATMLPASYTVFVAPLAVSIEVLFVTVIRQDRIFPVGVGEVGMALFAAVVVAAIATVVMLPALSGWLQHVDTLRMRQREVLARG